MILQRLTLLLGGMTISMKFVEKQLVTKAQKHERLISLSGTEACAIKNLVAKALADNEISEKCVGAILAEIEKVYNDQIYNCCKK